MDSDSDVDSEDLAEQSVLSQLEIIQMKSQIFTKEQIDDILKYKSLKDKAKKKASKMEQKQDKVLHNLTHEEKDNAHHKSE